MYLIDTDWAVDYLKGIDEKVRFLQNEEELYISALSVGELVEGIERQKCFRFYTVTLCNPAESALMAPPVQIRARP
jgi:predicted nucleic acid-binding protein